MSVVSSVSSPATPLAPQDDLRQAASEAPSPTLLSNIPGVAPVIIGAGPAGIRAAQTLVAAGLRPVVLDEAPRAGGQIYRQPPPGFVRTSRERYGSEAGKADALHRTMQDLLPHIDYRPDTLAWHCESGMLDVVRAGVADAVPFSHLILATGATDRVLPFDGWTTPGVYTLGGAQVALKYQGCAIGARVAFLGTGPLLYLVAYQYAKAGAKVVAVLDTAGLSNRLRALPGMLRAPRLLAQGLYYMAWLRAHGVPLHTHVRPVRIESGANDATEGGVAAGARAHAGTESGTSITDTETTAHAAGRAAADRVAADRAAADHVAADRAAADHVAADRVTALHVRHRDGRVHRIECDAVGYGLALRSETQLASLAGCAFDFDAQDRAWLPRRDAAGRSSVPGVYLAGDGAGIAGADAAEVAGERAALALCADIGVAVDPARVRALERTRVQSAVVRRALALAFPFPDDWAAALDDRVTLCRCEEITVGTLRATAAAEGVTELNRLKALTRVGMGRCQGRMCGAAAAEVVAASMYVPIDSIGRIRAQPPVKPLSVRIDGSAP